MSLIDEYHKRSDHGRDGASMDSFTCNCRELFAEHDKQVLSLVRAAVQAEINDGFGPYMKNIQRALQGKAPKKKQVKK